MLDSIEDLRVYINDKNYKVVIWGAGYLGTNWAFDFLKEQKIKVDFYCDNDCGLWNKTIKDCLVLCPRELERIKNEIFVFVILGQNASKEVIEQLDSLQIDNRIEYTDLLHLQGVREQFFPFMDERIAVYTCVTNGYDDICIHDSLQEQCDYFVITDSPQMSNEKITYLDIRDCIPKDVKDFTRQNRYCKINAHKIFPQYRFSIYADANTIFTSDFTFLINKLPTTRIAVASELFEDSVYNEAIRLINSRRDDPNIISEQMRAYWLQGMPDHFGQYWNYVLLREHNHPNCRKLMDEWWGELEKYSKRDQLSLPFVIWKNGYQFGDVMIIDKEGCFWRRNKSHKHGISRVE